MDAEVRKNAGATWRLLYGAPTCHATTERVLAESHVRQTELLASLDFLCKAVRRMGVTYQDRRWGGSIEVLVRESDRLDAIHSHSSAPGSSSTASSSVSTGDAGLCSTSVAPQCPGGQHPNVDQVSNCEISDSDYDLVSVQSAPLSRGRPEQSGA